MELVVCHSVNVVALTSKIVISVKSDNQKLIDSSDTDVEVVPVPQ